MVLSKNFRSLIHSRLELGLQGYAHSHPNTYILLVEPDHHDPGLFLANAFDYSRRTRLAEHACQRNRAHLRSQRSTLGPLLARHGLVLDDAVPGPPSKLALATLRGACPPTVWRNQICSGKLEWGFGRASACLSSEASIVPPGCRYQGILAGLPANAPYRFPVRPGTCPSC